MKMRLIPRCCRLREVAVGLALLASPANTQETKTVTGTATYRERIALPPDAVFEATLEDVSRPDSPAEVIGRTRLERPGQPPFQFSIQYDPSRIVESHSYAVRARITADGNLMFTTDQSYPVLTRGHGSQLATMIMRRAGGSSTGGTGGAGGAGFHRETRAKGNVSAHGRCRHVHRLPEQATVARRNGSRVQSTRSSLPEEQATTGRRTAGQRRKPRCGET